VHARLAEETGAFAVRTARPSLGHGAWGVVAPRERASAALLGPVMGIELVLEGVSTISTLLRRMYRA
jgi:hypothetical protein